MKTRTRMCVCICTNHLFLSFKWKICTSVLPLCWELNITCLTWNHVSFTFFLLEFLKCVKNSNSATALFWCLSSMSSLLEKARSWSYKYNQCGAACTGSVLWLKPLIISRCLQFPSMGQPSSILEEILLQNALKHILNAAYIIEFLTFLMSFIITKGLNSKNQVLLILVAHVRRDYHIFILLNCFTISCLGACVSPENGSFSKQDLWFRFHIPRSNTPHNKHSVNNYWTKEKTNYVTLSHSFMKNNKTIHMPATSKLNVQPYLFHKTSPV